MYKTRRFALKTLRILHPGLQGLAFALIAYAGRRLLVDRFPVALQVNGGTIPLRWILTAVLVLILLLIFRWVYVRIQAWLQARLATKVDAQ